MREIETTAEGTELEIGALYEVLGMRGMKYHGQTGSGLHWWEHPSGRMEGLADARVCELIGRGDISVEEGS